MVSKIIAYTYSSLFFLQYPKFFTLRSLIHPHSYMASSLMLARPPGAKWGLVPKGRLIHEDAKKRGN